MLTPNTKTYIGMKNDKTLTDGLSTEGDEHLPNEYTAGENAVIEPIVEFETLLLSDLINADGSIDINAIRAVKIRVPFLSNFVDKVMEKLRGRKPKYGKILNASVKSTNLKTIAYSPDVQMMECVFNKEDRIYVYYDVPIHVYKKLLNAPSKGKYHWREIRFKYDYDEL